MRLDKRKVHIHLLQAGMGTFDDLSRALGVTAPTMSRYLSGDYRPSWEKLEAMCRLLNCTVDDIVTYDFHEKTPAM